MKKQIAIEQWNELNDEEKKNFWGEDYHHNIKDFWEKELPDLGDLIEFLGDDWLQEICPTFHSLDTNFPKNDDLVDRLWEAVKHKLGK